MNTGNNSSHDLPMKPSLLINFRNQCFKTARQVGKLMQEIKQWQSRC